MAIFFKSSSSTTNWESRLVVDEDYNGNFRSERVVVSHMKSTVNVWNKISTEREIQCGKRNVQQLN